MKQNNKDYEMKNYLGSGEDMAHNHYDSYRVEDKIHIVYKNGNVSTEYIKTIKCNMDGYLWTPFIQWI